MITKRSPYFESQRQGLWRWSRLIISLPLSAIVGMLGASLLLGAIYVAGRLGLGSVSDAIDVLISEGEIAVSDPVDVAVQLALIGAIFWPAAIAATLVHRRSVGSLIAPLHRFRWSIVGKVLTLQIIILIVGTVATLPWLEGIRFTRPGIGLLVWLIPIALVTLFQTSAEDVFFKGYLLRQVGAAAPLWWLAPVVVTALFVSLHIGNPDVSSELWLILPYFVISELFIIYLVMRTGGMEAALVTHWWNNFFIFVVLAEAATQANDLTLFVFDEDPSTSVDEVWGVGGAIIGIGLQYLGFTWRRSPFYLDRHGWTPPESPPPPPPPPNSEPNMAPPPPPAVHPPLA